MVYSLPYQKSHMEQVRNRSERETGTWQKLSQMIIISGGGGGGGGGGWCRAGPGMFAPIDKTELELPVAHFLLP